MTRKNKGGTPPILKAAIVTGSILAAIFLAPIVLVNYAATVLLLQPVVVLLVLVAMLGVSGGVVAIGWSWLASQLHGRTTFYMTYRWGEGLNLTDFFLIKVFRELSGFFIETEPEQEYAQDGGQIVVTKQEEEAPSPLKVAGHPPLYYTLCEIDGAQIPIGDADNTFTDTFILASPVPRDKAYKTKPGLVIVKNIFATGAYAAIDVTKTWDFHTVDGDIIPVVEFTALGCDYGAQLTRRHQGLDAYKVYPGGKKVLEDAANFYGLKMWADMKARYDALVQIVQGMADANLEVRQRMGNEIAEVYRDLQEAGVIPKPLLAGKVKWILIALMLSAVFLAALFVIGAATRHPTNTTTTTAAHMILGWLQSRLA